MFGSTDCTDRPAGLCGGIHLPVTAGPSPPPPTTDGGGVGGGVLSTTVVEDATRPEDNVTWRGASLTELRARMMLAVLTNLKSDYSISHSDS